MRLCCVCVAEVHRGPVQCDYVVCALQKFIQDPYSATMGGFSKVTHFLRDTLLTGDRASPSTEMMMSSELTTNLAPSNLAVNSLSEAGFEVITAVSSSLCVISSSALEVFVSCMFTNGTKKTK